MYKRDIEPLGADGREYACQMLAEGDVEAILRVPDRERYLVRRRMWDKENLERKVHPRFEDGWMRMWDEESKKHVCGWLFVPKGAFSSLKASSQEPAPSDSIDTSKQEQASLGHGNKRRSDPETDSKLRNKIETVKALARKKWPNEKKRPSCEAMAKELERLHSIELGYKHETIRKILDGTYPASRRLEISGL